MRELQDPNQGGSWFWWVFGSGVVFAFALALMKYLF
jgi:hypothetical protein